MVGDVQQIRVLELFTQPLQQTHWLVQSDGHGHSGQVLADVVVQDGHDANVAVVRPWGGEGSAAAWITATQVSIASVLRPPASWVKQFMADPDIFFFFFTSVCGYRAGLIGSIVQTGPVVEGCSGCGGGKEVRKLIFSRGHYMLELWSAVTV